MRPLRTLTAPMSAIAAVLVFATLHAAPAAAQQRGDSTRAPRTPNAGPRAVPGARPDAMRGAMPSAMPSAVPGAMRGQRGPQARNMRQDGNPAAQLLRLRGPLNLTNDQVSRLEKLAETPPARANPADMLRARADLLDAMQGNGNLAGARAALDKMSRLRNEQTLAGLKLRQDARAVLTADQQRTWDNTRNRMRGAAVRNMIGPDRAMQDRTMRPRGMRGQVQGGRMAPRMMPGVRPGMQPGMQPGMRRGLRPGMAPQGVPPMPTDRLDVDTFENSDSHIRPN